MSFSFQCRTCGEIHEGLPSFGPDEPDSYFALSEFDRLKYGLLGSDNCIIANEQFFVRGRIELPIVGREDSFVWLVWCSLSTESFLQWEEAYDLENRSHIGPFFGWLNTELPFYEGSFNLATSVHLVDNGARPFVEIHETDHRLFVDQSNGITALKAEQLIHDLLHQQ